MRSTRPRALLACALMFAATGRKAAFAAETASAADATKPGLCDADTRKFCADLPNGVPRCLSENAPSLSKRCRLWVRRYDRAKKKTKLVCRSALKASCPDAQGWDALLACIRTHKASKAPPACIASFQSLMKARAVVLNRALTPVTSLP